jgi:hypothetical protein
MLESLRVDIPHVGASMPAIGFVRQPPKRAIWRGREQKNTQGFGESDYTHPAMRSVTLASSYQASDERVLVETASLGGAMADTRSRLRTRRRRMWLWALPAALIGFPLVVVMPALTALLLVVLGVSGLVSAGGHRPNSARLLAAFVGLLIPVSLYLVLAIAKH